MNSPFAFFAPLQALRETRKRSRGSKGWKHFPLQHYGFKKGFLCAFESSCLRVSKPLRHLLLCEPCGKPENVQEVQKVGSISTSTLWI